MKILIKNLRRILLVQLFIVGATLSITATNAGAAALACAFPETASDTIRIGSFIKDTSFAGTMYSGYLTTGEVDELDFRNECKNYTKFRKVFRNELKIKHDYCTGIGEECKYSGSPGCGITGGDVIVNCYCEIEFTYCTQTSTSNAIKDSKSGGRSK